MAVLRSQRKISDTEFENTFMRLYCFSREETSSVPKRRKRWLCTDIDLTMNKIYRNIMEINECYFRDRTDKQKYINELSDSSVELLLSLEKPLMSLWNIQHYETKTMVHWVTQINKEIELLNLIHKTEIGDKIMIIDWCAVNSMRFLNNMSALHRYTHSKVTNAMGRYDDTEGALLISLIDDALYSLISANRKIPTTREEYIVRSKYISHSISCLKQLNRRMLAYFNLMQYSERIMREWSDMLIEELNLLIGLQKSDKSRFKNLE